MSLDFKKVLCPVDSGSHSTELGDIHARGYGDRGAASLRDGRDLTAKAEGRCGVRLVSIPGD